MRIIIATAFIGAFVVPAGAAPASDSTAARPTERRTVLALNPQPEPPGKAKIKRIYSGKGDPRKPVKPVKPSPVKAPATKY